MLRLARLAPVCVLAAVCAFAQADWTTATDLPEVDFKGMTPAQQKEALDLLRAEPCTCGCDMKLAECRIMDPKCHDSRALAYIVTEGIRNRRTAAQIHDDLIHSPIAKLRADQNRILGDPVKINIAGSPSRGPANAKVTLVEYSDFECPYCSLAVPQIDQLVKTYPNDIRLVFKQFPLDMHPHAIIAAEASLAANAQGKFWEMYEKLFAGHKHLTRDSIFAMAKDLNLDMVRFTHDMDSHAYLKEIRQDLAEGEHDGVFGTPSLFVNGKPYHGPIQVSMLNPILQDEIKGKPADGQQTASR
jgi:protein-disulfide isomerase